jgi:hypothetical protein
MKLFRITSTPRGPNSTVRSQNRLSGIGQDLCEGRRRFGIVQHPILKKDQSVVVSVVPAVGAGKSPKAAITFIPFVRVSTPGRIR